MPKEGRNDKTKWNNKRNGSKKEGGQQIDDVCTQPRGGIDTMFSGKGGGGGMTKIRTLFQLRQF